MLFSFSSFSAEEIKLPEKNCYHFRDDIAYFYEGNEVFFDLINKNLYLPKRAHFFSNKEFYLFESFPEKNKYCIMKLDINENMFYY